MAKVFFSYAFEDREAVAAVYATLAAHHPEHEPWMARYEIVAGDSLLTKIAAGMDAAEKFFVFLSAISVTKPWVQRELRRAIMREINGVDPDYIAPVKIGGLPTLPAFLEDKRYIDLERLRQEEWLAEFDAAIRGTPTRREDAQPVENIEVQIEAGPEGPHVAHLHFTAKMWAEEFSFVVETSQDLMPLLGGLGAIPDLLLGNSFALTRPRLNVGPRMVALAFETPELRPGRPISMRLGFAPGVDATTAITRIRPWRPT